ncbi:MAG: RHS repeat-associated core domain-containing protein, partial [Myxococcota bacterium]
ARRMLTSERPAVVALHHDHLGSAVLATGEGGSVLGRSVFGAFGNRMKHDGYVDRYGFTGQEHEPYTSLVRFAHRFLAPQSGQWLSPDPAFTMLSPGTHSRLPEAVARYSYVLNNPGTFVDPDGRTRQGPSKFSKAVKTARQAVGRLADRARARVRNLRARGGGADGGGSGAASASSGASDAPGDGETPRTTYRKNSADTDVRVYSHRSSTSAVSDAAPPRFPNAASSGRDRVYSQTSNVAGVETSESVAGNDPAAPPRYRNAGTDTPSVISRTTSQSESSLRGGAYRKASMDLEVISEN